MINLNLLFFPTLILALALFGLGFRFALKSPHPRALLFGAMAAPVTAIPALLFALYYTHLFDRAIWFYEFRALPYTGLSAAGLGWTTGMVMGRLQRRVFRGQSKGVVGILWGVALFCFLLILFVPYAKPLIAPLRGTFPTHSESAVGKAPYPLHGAVIVHHYPSRTFGEKRRMHVYTPPGYDPKGTTRYPVLYLLTGSPGDDSNWTTVGVNRMLDTMITANQCEPCIVVMPDSEFRHKRFGHKGFEHDLFTDILPLIERTYRVKTDADSRAIAGLSMGGFFSIEIGLNHLDRFHWIGVFSAGLRKDFVTPDNITGLGANPKQAVASLKLFYLRIGKRDFFLTDARRLDHWLTQKSVPHLYQEVEGAHEWPVWLGSFADFAPRLFKEHLSIGR